MDNRFDLFSDKYDEIFRRLKEETANSSIIIFGAGTGGKILSNIFKVHNIEIKLVVDNDVNKWNTNLYNIRVLKPESLLAEENKLVFTASVYHDDISRQLESYGLEENVHCYNGMQLIEFLHTCQSIDHSVLGDFTIWLNEKKKSNENESRISILDKEIRPCHRDGLFIREDGSVFPCCRLRDTENLKIGHLSDYDIVEKIKNYDSICSCLKYSLRKIEAEEFNFNYINVEFSLLCQAQCAMCCVEAPGNGNPYKYFDELGRLISSLNPNALTVQGGEVIIQKDTMEFLKNIKIIKPNMKISVISNACYDLNKAEIVEDVFDYMHVSMVGFQSETYKRIMGLDIDKTTHFIDTLIKRGKVGIGLKYLVTPLNVHEVGLFLNWAIQRELFAISIADSNIDQYVNFNSWDNFWNKIISRTSVEVKTLLIKGKKQLLQSNIEVGFDYSTRKLYDINDKYIQENDLNNVIRFLV